MEMRCYRKLPLISCKDHIINEEVRAKIQQAMGPHDLLTIVKRRKLQWYGHVSRISGLAKTILQGTVKGGRRQGRQRKSGKITPGNGQAWSSAGPRAQWRTGKNGEKCEIICGAPTTLAIKMMMMMFGTRNMCDSQGVPKSRVTLECQILASC